MYRYNSGRRYRYSRKRAAWVPYDEWLARRGLKRANPAYRQKKSASSYKRKAAAAGGSRYRGAGSALGAAIGSAVGGAPGTAIGAALGAAGADLIKSVTGFGDYKVSYNTILFPDQVPQFREKGRSVIVNHREYIQDITSSSVAGAFNINSFIINPGDPATFPWLNNLAEQFEEYRVHGMIFEFKTTSSDALNSTNTALGTVVMATQYNSIAPVFTNKQQMENYEFGASTKPSCSLMHAIECDPKVTSFGPIFTVRQGAGTDTGDVRLYDLGKFSIATVGLQGTSVNVGELWCTYSIELFKPRQSSVDFAAHWQLGGAAGTVTAAAPLSNAVLTSTSANNTGITLSNTVVTFPSSFSGNVLVVYDALGTVGASTVAPAIAASAGATALNLVNSDAQNAIQGTFLAATTYLYEFAYFSLVNGGKLTFSGGTYPTGVVVGDLFINTFPNALIN